MGIFGGLIVPVVNRRVEKKKAVVVGLERKVRSSKFFCCKMKCAACANWILPNIRKNV